MPQHLDELRMIDPVLTTIAQGYTNSSMIYETLFPTVSVSKMKGKIPVFGKEAFVLRNTERAIRASSNRIPPAETELITFETVEQDIETAIDYLEEEESPDFYKLEQRIARQLVDMLNLGKEKLAAQLALNPASYPIGHSLAVDAGTAFNDYTNTTDPIAVIQDCISTVRTKIGRFPNTIVMGEDCFKAIINHPKVIERIKYSGKYSINSQILATLLNIDNISIGLAVSSQNGIDFTDIWNDSIVIAYTDKNEKSLRNEYNPSFGYTFQREGKPEIDSYYENGGKIKVIRNTDNYTVKITANVAGFLISNTNH